MHKTGNNQTEDGPPKVRGLGELIQNSSFLRNFIFSNLIWCTAVFNYYLISFYIKYFPGNLFVNSLIFASADLFSYMTSGIILNLTNTRICMWLTHSTTIIGATLYLLFNSNYILLPISILLCRVGNSMTFNTVYVTHNRLFPPYLLTSTFGLLNLSSHILTIPAPILAEVSNPYPILIFLGCSITGFISSFFIKELFVGKEASSGHH